MPLITILILGMTMALTALPNVAWASDYLQAEKEGQEIPGQGDYFPLIPQGIWGLDNDRFIVSGYLFYGQPSDRQRGMVGPTGLWVIGDDEPHFILAMHEGQPLVSHAGGIAIDGDVIYIASGRDGWVYRGQLDLSAKIVSVKRVLQNPVPSSYLTIDDDGNLWVGQFYNGSSNHLGEWRRGRHVWRGVAIAYDRDAYQAQRAIAVRRKVQGIILSQDHMALSLSYGQRNDSTLAIYPDPRLQEAQEELTLPDGSAIPLYLPLGRMAEHTLPPMAEEIWLDQHSGLVWMAYESAALRRFPRVRPAHRQSRLQAYRIAPWGQ